MHSFDNLNVHEALFKTDVFPEWRRNALLQLCTLDESSVIMSFVRTNLDECILFSETDSRQRVAAAATTVTVLHVVLETSCRRRVVMTMECSGRKQSDT